MLLLLSPYFNFEGKFGLLTALYIYIFFFKVCLQLTKYEKYLLSVLSFSVKQYQQMCKCVSSYVSCFK